MLLLYLQTCPVEVRTEASSLIDVFGKRDRSHNDLMQILVRDDQGATSESRDRQRTLSDVYRDIGVTQDVCPWISKEIVVKNGTHTAA